jgi:ribosomal protein L11 methyltransferase
MIELQLLAPQSLVEGLSDALLDLGALSVSVEDAQANTEQEKALFGEPGSVIAVAAWESSKVLCLFEDEASAQQALGALRELDGPLDLEQPQGWQLHAMKTVEDQDWVRLTQSQFQPVGVTPDFWIVPSWSEVPQAAQKVIRLDPGLAFGTGTHPTTRMCLSWCSRQQFDHQRVMDYGCGSGILAIAAALHGCQHVQAVDIDEAAVESARQNAQDNGVAASLEVGLPVVASGVFDAVFANILASPLKVLAPLLAALVRPGGVLVLSGILERQSEELHAAYAPYADLQVIDAQEGWVLMSARF